MRIINSNKSRRERAAGEIVLRLAAAWDRLRNYPVAALREGRGKKSTVRERERNLFKTNSLSRHKKRAKKEKGAVGSL